jgi:hypothetical protein
MRKTLLGSAFDPDRPYQSQGNLKCKRVFHQSRKDATLSHRRDTIGHPPDERPNTVSFGLRLLMVQFKDARLKIKRANKHIVDLETAIGLLKESCTATVEMNAETTHQNLIHMIPKFAETMDDLSLIAGDAIHNLRSALDLAWVSVLGIHIPTADRDFAKFPVRSTRQEVEAALNGIQINCATNSAIFNCIVTDIQPYSGGKFNEIVPTLHKLDICDKHLVLLELGPNAGISNILVRNQDGEIIRGFTHATETSPPWVIPFHGDFRIEDKGKLAFDILLKEAGIFESIDVVEALHMFSNAALHYVELLENI